MALLTQLAHRSDNVGSSEGRGRDIGVRKEMGGGGRGGGVLTCVWYDCASFV